MLSMMIYISFCVRDKTGVLTCFANNVLWRASTMSTITVFVKIVLIPLSKIYIQKLHLSSLHILEPAQSLYLTLLYHNQSLLESCFHNLPVKDARLVDNIEYICPIYIRRYSWNTLDKSVCPKKSCYIKLVEVNCYQIQMNHNLIP